MPDQETEAEKENLPLPFFPAGIADEEKDGALVVIVSTALEFASWLEKAGPEVQWIEVRNLLDAADLWTLAARGGNPVALDVVVDDPGREYSLLYRLVDVRSVRDVRVSIPLIPGFMKALKLAASIQLPVRILPGQPGPDLIRELEEAVEFYLRDPMVEAPVDFFHSAIAVMRGAPGAGLWLATEMDPSVNRRHDESGNAILPFPLEDGEPAEFVGQFQAFLDRRGTGCGGCRWQNYCGGFFKQPDPDYNCEGVLGIFDRLAHAAEEMNADLSAMPPESAPSDP